MCCVLILVYRCFSQTNFERYFAQIPHLALLFVAHGRHLTSHFWMHPRGTAYIPFPWYHSCHGALPTKVQWRTSTREKQKEKTLVLAKSILRAQYDINRPVDTPMQHKGAHSVFHDDRCVAVPNCGQRLVAPLTRFGHFTHPRICRHNRLQKDCHILCVLTPLSVMLSITITLPSITSLSSARKMKICRHKFGVFHSFSGRHICGGLAMRRVICAMAARSTRYVLGREECRTAACWSVFVAGSLWHAVGIYLCV
jgi:hypothetical protein